jgi:hypothetical protein
MNNDYRIITIWPVVTVSLTLPALSRIQNLSSRVSGWGTEGLLPGMGGGLTAEIRLFWY